MAGNSPVRARPMPQRLMAPTGNRETMGTETRSGSCIKYRFLDLLLLQREQKPKCECSLRSNHYRDRLKSSTDLTGS